MEVVAMAGMTESKLSKGILAALCCLSFLTACQKPSSSLMAPSANSAVDSQTNKPSATEGDIVLTDVATATTQKSAL